MGFVALQCYSCFTMQVKEQRKKSSLRKWSCTMCNEKQSLLRIFATSDAAKDVRKFVQDFNITRGRMSEVELVSNCVSSCADGEATDDMRFGSASGNHETLSFRNRTKWDRYLEKEVSPELSEAEEVSNGDEVVTCFPEEFSCKRQKPAQIVVGSSIEQGCCMSRRSPLTYTNSGANGRDVDPEMHSRGRYSSGAVSSRSVSHPSRELCSSLSKPDDFIKRRGNLFRELDANCLSGTTLSRNSSSVPNEEASILATPNVRTDVFPAPKSKWSRYLQDLE